MNAKKMNLLSNIIRISLIVVGVIATLAVIYYAPATDAEKITKSEFGNGGVMSFATMFTVGIIVLTFALVIGFFVMQLISNPKKTLMSIIGIVIAAVLFFLLYFMGSSDNNETLGLVGDKAVSDATHSLTQAGIFTVATGLLVGVLAILLFGIKNAAAKLQK